MLAAVSPHRNPPPPPPEPPGGPVSQPRVGYQGEPGAFGESAAAVHGGLPVAIDTFEDLLAALEVGAIDEAVLPVDNVAVGPIFEALEPLTRAVLGGLRVVATGLTSVPVRLALAARPGTPLAAVKRALSHPAALRQCARRLVELGVAPEPAIDTAGAARDVARGDPSDAAICSARASQLAGLHVLVEDVSDIEANGTRFLHLRRADKASPSVSLAFVRAAGPEGLRRLEGLLGSTLLVLAGTAEWQVRVWVIGAPADTLDDLTRHGFTVVGLGAPRRPHLIGPLPDPSATAGEIRAWIDASDKALLEAVARRLELARMVGIAKRRAGAPMRDLAREAAVRERYRAALPGYGDLPDRLFELLLSGALRVQGVDEE